MLNEFLIEGNVSEIGGKQFLISGSESFIEGNQSESGGNQFKIGSN